ncbi:hypothetical protein Tcan_01311, partial [Toxocara canis]
IKWSFVTAFAPWKGGVYERFVGLTKNAIRRTIGRRLPDRKTFQTFITETEAVINQRPMTFIESDSLEVLRPADFLRPRANFLTEVEVDKNEECMCSPSPPSSTEALVLQWDQTQRCLQKFWTAWQHEYLHLLREREQHRHSGPYAQT